MTLLDVTRTDDRHTSERLSAEPIIWLGTVRPDGRPHNVPVWFAWHDPMVLIFSMPKTAKVAPNPARDPNVMLPRIIRPEPQVASWAEVEAIVAKATPKYRIILRLLEALGVRAGELVQLTWGDIDWTRQRIRIKEPSFSR